MNLYPYTAGHLMIVPYRHVARLGELTTKERDELIRLAQRAEGILEALFDLPTMQIGINIGRCAGAGVDGHLHIHLVPLGPEKPSRPAPQDPSLPPEALVTTRDRLRSAWADAAPAQDHLSGS
jgi:ATP adenylyltransferase